MSIKNTAVVILNWNGKGLLEKFLPSVVRYSSDVADVVVIDNGSTDASRLFVQSHYPMVTLVTLDKNYGFAEGYNRGLSTLNYTYVVLLNSDVEVTENWLSPMISYLDSHPEVVAAQPKLLDYKNPSRFEYAGACGGFIDKFGYPFCRGRILDNLESDKGQYDGESPILWASGAALFIRLEEYIKAGGLDSTFFAHMEEIDLCWRLVARGWIIVSIPQSVVYHVGGATLSTSNPRKLYLNFRNNLLMLYKNLPRKFFLRVMMARYFLDLLAAVRLFITLHPRQSLSVFRAHYDFLRMKKQYKEKQKENWEMSKNLYHSPVYQHSILFSYYFKRRRTFAELPF